jgi:hypothetical protein
MRWFILQLVAVASTVALALPPGACSLLMHEAQVEQASCCHPKPHKPAPHAPAERCCCAQDSTLPEKSAVAPVSLDLLLHLAFMPPVAERGVVAAGVRETLPIFGPRLHVLKCVWRC